MGICRCLSRVVSRETTVEHIISARRMGARCPRTEPVSDASGGQMLPSAYLTRGFG